MAPCLMALEWLYASDYCGALSSCGFSSTHLSKPYKKAYGQVIAEGSKGRLARVRIELHPVPTETTWPDGRSTKHRVHFKRFYLGDEATMSSKSQQAEQHQILQDAANDYMLPEQDSE